MHLSNRAFLIKYCFQVVKPEAYTFCNGLSCVTREENVFLSHSHQERDQILSQILDFIDHQKMHFWKFTRVFPFHLAKNMIYNVVLIICAKVLLPLFVLQKNPID